MCLFPKTIVPKILVSESPKVYRYGEPVTVSCGKCLECQQRYSNDWSLRIMKESKAWDCASFVTLTYDTPYLPQNLSVDRKEVTLWIKRLRKAISPLRIKFFACGEYGSKSFRPHYHAIIFGYDFPDKYFWKSQGKDSYYRSPLLEKTWTKGYSLISDLTLDSARYCAKYLNKLQFDYIKGLGFTPPFVQMSHNLGLCAFDESLEALQDDRMIAEGHSFKVPRYYLRKLEEEGVNLDSFKAKRQVVGEMKARTRDLPSAVAKVKRFVFGDLDSTRQLERLQESAKKLRDSLNKAKQVDDTVTDSVTKQSPQNETNTN